MSDIPLRFLAMTMVLVLNAGAQSSITPGGCVTRSGTLCRTVVYEASGWTNRSWFFHAIDRYHERITAAVRSDGRAMHRVAHDEFQSLVHPAIAYDRSRIILPAKNRTLEIEHDTMEVRDLGGVWWLLDFWPKDDGECSVRATMAGEARRITGHVKVAGIPAIEYVYSGFLAQQRIAFAPSLGCDAVEISESEWNLIGFPVNRFKFTLVSVSLGEPAESLLDVPGGYRLVPPDSQWRYVDLNTFPGHVTSTGFSKVVP